MTTDNVTRGYGFLEAFLAKQRARMAGQLIPAAARLGRILDIGCGTTPFFLIHTDFKEKYGVDPAVNQAHSSNNISLRQFDIAHHQQFDFEDAFFDVVTMLAVFEHIEPGKLPAVLTEVRRILKAEGRFILTTPAPWTDKLLRMMAKVRLVSPDEIEEHKGAYSHGEIAAYLLQAGFKQEKIELGYFEMFLNVWAYGDK